MNYSNPDSSVYCRIGVLVSKSLGKLLDRMGYSLEWLEEFEIDFYGPRVFLKFRRDRVESSLDFSPDGCEHQISVRAERGLDESIVEDYVAELIETSEDFESIESYDVFYDPEEGVVVVVLETRLVEHQPSINSIIRIVDEAIGRAKTGK